MIYSAKLLTAGEAASVLWNQLGPIRNWSNFLADCIRSKQAIAGITLTPCARLQGMRGLRPAYSLADIEAFIRAVKAVMPDAGKPACPVTVQLDTSRGWRISKFDRKGNSVAQLSGMAHACGMSRFTTTTAKPLLTA